jgi:mannose-6-phosphate isomerase
MATDSLGREFDERPWGNYTVLDESAFDHKVKRIVVNPDSRLSYQRHTRRAEHWFIVSGEATVILEGETRQFGPGDSISIGLGQAHRVENRGTTPVIFIEVQYGTYFGEDDIERLEDDYGRAEN